MQSQQKVPGMTLSKQLVKRSLYLYVLPATNHLFVGACNESGELNDLNTQTPDSVKKSRTELRRGYLVVEENLGWIMDANSEIQGKTLGTGTVHTYYPIEQRQADTWQDQLTEVMINS